MATYYVRTDGSDSNTGTGPGTGQAWATVGKAVSATGMSSGDTVYVAPGVYSALINVLMTSATANTYVTGDPLATQFPGVTPGQVICTNYNTALTAAGFSNHVIVATSKNFLYWSNINFKYNPPFGINAATVRNWTFEKCTFSQRTSGGPLITMTSPASTAMNLTINQCIFHGGTSGLSLTGGGVPDNTSIKNSVFRNCAQGIGQVACQTSVFNSLFLCSSFAINQSGQSLVFPATITNCITANCSNDLIGGVTGTLIETYNRLLGASARSNVDPGTGSVTIGDIGVDIGESLLQGLPNIAQLTSFLSSPNANFGTLTGAPATDIYGNTWTGPNPDAGAGTYKVLSSAYSPTERNAGVITIAPGSTSQSIELYLGVTGLTSSSSGLSARYNRTRTASVAITLVARTIAQAWTSGGFAEVDATNMPGVYRLDLPDAAVAAGADDVTIVVRGASGTNGAVMTVKLSSGGLTEAQTAGAVWNAVRATYPTAGTFGEYVNVNVNSGAIADAVWDEARSGHTTVGTFGQYVNAELVTPVTAGTSVHIGPYQLLADGLGADQPLDVNVGTASTVDVQVTDANGTGIDITGATTSAKVYSSTGTLVATYAGTATYADNGRLSFGLTTTVTDTSGTYTVTVTRTTGATDTQIFGPLRLYVRPV